MDPSKILDRLERKTKLSQIERILAVTDGSVTQILEAYLRGPVGIRTIRQEVKCAGAFAERLHVDPEDETNFREVEIVDQGGRALVRARSWTPLKRLEPGFKEDLMKADVPIGKLLARHGIEARRELTDVRLENGRIKRTYNIIRKGGIMMIVEELILL